MELYLIRHIEPDFKKGICYGQLDVPIPHNYKEQHEGIIAKLPKDHDAVYSSPLTRCKLLAEHISDSVIFDDRLKEISFGDWEGKNWNDINQTELNHWMENYIEIAPPNGESLQQLVNRFSSFISDIKTKKHSKIIIVSHAGIIRSAMHLLGKIPINKIMMEKIDFGYITTLNLV